MATDVVMPQMGESIAEGTIVRWIKKVGDAVERDEPLFEISTDKVDAEIPSPVAGVVAEIRAKEGQTVPINTVVAVIGPAGAKPAETKPAEAKPAVASAPAETPLATKPAAPPPTAQPAADGAGARPSGEPAPPPSTVAPPTPGAAEAAAPESTEAPSAGRETERSSPLVRRIAKEHNVDISKVKGTGIGGRVTKEDILAFIGGTPSGAASTGGAPSSAAASAPSTPGTARAPKAPPAVSPLAGTTVAMSPMRKRIAEHMIQSRKTSAHVHSVFEVNFSKVARVREAKKAEFEKAGAKLTYMSFILAAVVDALRAVPVVNASVDGDNIVYHKDINIGVAVALDWGLIVPVIKNADSLSLLDLSRAVVDLATRARSKQLKPDDVAGGTFTITNPGVFGALFGMPIISQPQVAILGVGNIEKRPIVIDDAIAIRTMAYLSIGYDHRIIDGAVADEFMSHVKKTLETWDRP
ncbi:MAG TPA: 2-oxoglutarate dehydrogenase, E2 component, dihydrolipoamide succinyltransferase [Vicinamibacterales bacterium]|nr:2-oxoglutarate dehydrogenase, E2 component, dihydrolipoamide succinyltransferase [Vicinamibacterales bacterium]